MKYTVQKGFTLIELLVVVAIIAVLAVIGVAVFSGVQNRGNTARVQADINSVAQALEAHKICAADGTSTTPGTFYCFPVMAAWFTNGIVPGAPSGYTYSLGTTATTGLTAWTVSGSGAGVTHSRVAGQ